MDKDSIIALLTPEKAEEAASDIVDYVEKNASENNLECEFDLSDGEVVNKGVNTYFKFDPPTGNSLREITDLFTSLFDCEDLNQEDGGKIRDFLINIRDTINNKYIDIFARKIREVLLHGASETVIPLKQIEVVNLEIGPKPEKDYLIVIQKLAPKGLIAPLIQGDLTERHEKTGQPLNDIIAERKAAGDERYKWVSEAYKKQGFFECELDFFVDYSLPKPPVVET